MWEIDSSRQIFSLFIAVLSGFFLCAVYDFLRASRRAGKNGTLRIAIEDIIFSASAGYFTFCMLLALCSGEIRIFFISGEAAGFIICRITLSKLLIKLLYPVFNLIYSLNNSIYLKYIGFLTSIKTFSGKIKAFFMKISKKY